jgi:hypothetical protein
LVLQHREEYPEKVRVDALAMSTVPPVTTKQTVTLSHGPKHNVELMVKVVALVDVAEALTTSFDFNCIVAVAVESIAFTKLETGTDTLSV